MKDISVETKQAPVKAVMDRRAFLSGVTATAGLGAALSLAPWTADGATAEAATETVADTKGGVAPVGTVFMELPYVDMTGTAQPYIPPARVGDQTPRARSPEADYWHTHFYI